MSVYDDDKNFLGRESYELRYGPSPKLDQSIVKTPLSESFSLEHKHHVDLVYVYLHGIGDSAYQGKDLARVFFNTGANVLSYRYSGHGADSPNINRVRVRDWQRDVDDAVSMAKNLAPHIILVGFSTGGALAIDKGYRSPKEISAIIGIAPALGFGSFVGRSLETVGLFRPLCWIFPQVGLKKHTQLTVRQIYKGSHSLHTLYQFGKGVRRRIEAQEVLQPPLLMVTTTLDQIIQYKPLVDLLSTSRVATWIKFTASRTDQKGVEEIISPDIPYHSAMVYDGRFAAHQVSAKEIKKRTGKYADLPLNELDETNPLFSKMSEKLIEFVEMARQ